jgi:transcriptional regulator with XRE-family HTH domain
MSPMWVHLHVYLHDRHRSEARRALGDLIRRTRQHRDITQERLGEWAGLHQSAISRLECGRPIGLRLVTLLRLFDALGIVRLDARLAAWHPWSTDPDLGDDGGQVDHSSDAHIRPRADRRCRRRRPARWREGGRRPQSPS